MNFINKFLTKPPSINVVLDILENKFHYRKDEKGNIIQLPIYNDWDPIKGKVIIDLNRNKNFQHQGIKIELLGIIETSNKRKSISKFISLCKDLESANELENEISQYEFEFSNVEKPHDTYKGNFNTVKYILKATLMTNYKNLEFDQEIIVQKPFCYVYGDNDFSNMPIHLEIGIEEWIHVSFHVFKNRFYLNDCVEGEVNFKVVSVKFSSMEVQIIRRETCGSGIIQISMIFQTYKI